MVSVTHRVNMWVGRSQYTENWPGAPESHHPHFMRSLLILFIKKKKIKSQILARGQWGRQPMQLSLHGVSFLQSLWVSVG